MFTVRKPTLHISMQYFADENQTNSESNAENAETKPTFDDILAQNPEYQAEFDRRMSKSQKTAVEAAKVKWTAEAKAQADEAAKLAKMEADEKAKYEHDKAEKELADRLKAVTARELKAEAREQLSAKGLPAELADILDYTDAENCKKSMESAVTAFNKAVEKAVNERLKGGGAPKAAILNKSKPFDNMTIDEKMAYANEHPNELKDVLQSFDNKTNERKN